MGFSKKELTYLVAGMMLLLISLVIYVYLVSFKDWGFDLTDKGTIGDAIGGITAPVIGILGAILVYISFISQVNANKLLTIQNEIKLIIELINELKRDLIMLHDSVSWGEPKRSTPFITGLREDKKNVPAKFKRQLIYAINTFIYVQKKTEKSSIIEVKEIIALINLLNNLYVSYLKIYCEEYDKMEILNFKRAPLNAELQALSKIMIALNKSSDEHYNNNE